MKANRKFIKGDEAVSPVIAVILMVAITVVLAATVYVWVSGFGSSPQQPAKTVSLTSNGALTHSGTNKTYTVTSASAGMKWGDVTLTLNGQTLSYNSTPEGADVYCVATSGSTCVPGDTWATSGSETVVAAGQQLKIRDTGLSGQTLRILDSQANSVILTLHVG